MATRLDRRLVDRAMLTPEESLWLDVYRARVAKTLTPLVDEKTRSWLSDATRPLG